MNAGQGKMAAFMGKGGVGLQWGGRALAVVLACGNGVESADQKLGQPGGGLSSSLRSDGTDA